MLLPPLFPGCILRRYKRFLADVVLADGLEVTAHCPNTGTMATCWRPGAAVQLSHSDNPKRKLAWTLERVDMGGGWIGVHTGRTNAVIAEGIEMARIPCLRGYGSLKREVPVRCEGGRSRLDIVLQDGEKPEAFVEVKNVTLLDNDLLRFPDAVSERGRRHLDVLEQLVMKGARGIILFALNRPEGEVFAPARDIDPLYTRRLSDAVNAGVEAIAVRLEHTSDGIGVGDPVPIDLNR
jgi:sugar fermentation stimulation protein A